MKKTYTDTEKLKAIIDTVIENNEVANPSQFAGKINKSRGYISNLLSGNNDVTSKLKKSIQQHFGVPLKYWNDKNLLSPVPFEKNIMPDLHKLVGNRLKTFREKYIKKEISFIANQLNIDTAVYEKIEQGKENITIQQLVIFADLYGVNINWLLLNMGEPVANSTSEKTSITTKGIPVYTKLPTAGIVADYIGSSTMKDIATETLYIPELRAQFAIKVFADNMTPTYKTGQIVALQETTKDMVFFGNKYLIYLKDGQRRIAKVNQCNKANCWVLSNDNKEYQDVEVNIDNITSLYTVTGYASIESM